MSKWSHSVLQGFERAVQGARANSSAVVVRPRVGRPAPVPASALAHAYEVTPAIGFAVIGSGRGCCFEVRRRALASGSEERLDLDHPDVAAMVWTIKVASTEQILDPGIKTLIGRDRRVELARPGHEGIRSLGVATTDAAGNLIVLPADDDCDGWVRAELQLRSGPRILAARITTAWFVAAHEFTLPEGRIDPDEVAPGDLTQKASTP